MKEASPLRSAWALQRPSSSASAAMGLLGAGAQTAERGRQTGEQGESWCFMGQIAGFHCFVMSSPHVLLIHQHNRGCVPQYGAEWKLCAIRNNSWNRSSPSLLSAHLWGLLLFHHPCPLRMPPSFALHFHHPFPLVTLWLLSSSQDRGPAVWMSDLMLESLMFVSTTESFLILLKCDLFPPCSSLDGEETKTNRCLVDILCTKTTSQNQELNAWSLSIFFYLDLFNSSP